MASGIRGGKMSDQPATLTGLMSGVNAVRKRTVAFGLAGSTAVAGSDDDPILGQTGVDYMMRQASCIGGAPRSWPAT
jgi:hypothetical protein